MMLAVFRIHAPRWRFLPTFRRTEEELQKFCKRMPELDHCGYCKYWN